MDNNEFKEIIGFLRKNATRSERDAAIAAASKAIGYPDGLVMTRQNFYNLFHTERYSDLTNGQRALFLALQEQVYKRIRSDMEVSKQFKQFKKQLA